MDQMAMAMRPKDEGHIYIASSGGRKQGQGLAQHKNDSTYIFRRISDGIRNDNEADWEGWLGMMGVDTIRTG